mmetsp:Transcript_14501/g.37593  ORF Transcript_14501/g.37593 Transcript_14501/m.37593 type:complete len:238 (+) Transcript_14501:777-1490(+)
MAAERGGGARARVEGSALRPHPFEEAQVPRLRRTRGRARVAAVPEALYMLEQLELATPCGAHTHKRIVHGRAVLDGPEQGINAARLGSVRACAHIPGAAMRACKCEHLEVSARSSESGRERIHRLAASEHGVGDGGEVSTSGCKRAHAPRRGTPSRLIQRPIERARRAAERARARDAGLPGRRVSFARDPLEGGARKCYGQVFIVGHLREDELKLVLTEPHAGRRSVHRWCRQQRGT